MKKTANRKGGNAFDRVVFQVSPIAAGCAVFVALAAGSAHAQQAQQATQQAQAAGQQAKTGDQQGKDAEAATVVVTGIRRGIEEAISIKKNATSIVEAISAEDIGKLPDASVAESISRLPGVSVQRSRATGKAADVSVRGLSPSFNGSLLNGREQASTGNARSPEFDLFPAELTGSILIYKTPDASLASQGLASTIDLHTLKPLDFGKRVLAANYRKTRTGVRSGSTEGEGDRYSFSYVDQFMDRTLGISLGLTKYEDTGGGQLKFNSWGGWTPDVAYNGGTVKVPGGFGSDTEQSTSARDGASLTLQYRPNKNFKSTVDVFYSSGENYLKKTGLEGALCGSAGNYDPNGVLTNATIVNGFAASGTCSNYKGVVRNHQEGSEDRLTSIGWNNQLQLDAWKLEADLSHSKGVKESSRYETTAGQPGNATNLGSISWTGFNGTNFEQVQYTTSLNYSDPNVAVLTDVMGWSGGTSSPQAGYVALPRIDDKVTSFRVSARRDVEWGPISAAKFGFISTKRDKERSGQEGRLVIAGDTTGYGFKPVPGGSTARAGTVGLPVISWNPVGSLGSVYSISEKIDVGILAKAWSVSEKVNTLYAMGELDSELMGIPYRGNVGVQIVHTDQVGRGNRVDESACTGNTAATCPSTWVSGGRSYWNVLPSLNTSFDLGNEQVVRFGLGKVISRANLDDLRSQRSVSLKTGGTTGGVPMLTGDGGNPELKPFSAKAVDLAYEKYFGKKAYFSVAGFYKKLDTYILRVPQMYDFKNDIGASTPLPTTGPFAGKTTGFFTQPRNGDGGNIKGFEVAVNLPLSMLTSYLDGFGVMLNHSDTRSGIDLPLSGFSVSGAASGTIKIPLPGLSRKVSNLRLYYEKHGLQVAAAARKRSDFLGTVSDFQDNQQLTFIKGDTTVDLQVSYEFQSGWFKGLSILAQANNWTNEPFQQHNGDGVITDKVVYGRTYLMGLNYKF